MAPSEVGPGFRSVNGQLERILASCDFDASSRGRALLRFLVAETLANRQETLSLAAIARHVFRRNEDFDSALDPAVQIEVARLGRALDRYYHLAGAEDAVCISLPRGSCVPVVRGASSKARHPREILGSLSAGWGHPKTSG